MSQLLLQFKPEVKVSASKGKGIRISSPTLHFSYPTPHPSLKILLKALQLGATKETLEAHWTASLPEFFYLLEKLKKISLLQTTLADKEKKFCTLFPYEELSQPSLLPSKLELSRFAYLRKEKGLLTLKSPLAKADLHLTHPKTLEVIHALSKPTSLKGLKAQVAEASEAFLKAFLSLLHEGVFLNPIDESRSLKTWEFHDLLMHTRSRQGRHQEPMGGTYRFLGKMPPLPPLRKLPKKGILPLFKPNMHKLLAKDAGFSSVLERRKSVREHGKKPITAEQLGEFLFRALRIKEIQKASAYDVTKRVYPGGGACHEIDLYLLIHQCRGIAPGLYRYHPDFHTLYLCSPPDEGTETLLKGAMHASLKKQPPQVLCILSARFQRVSWKYESIAYATILKNAGVLIQTMYLVATAMDLAPCSIGCGNSDLFAKIANTDYYEETSVAEFILGSKVV